MRFLARFFTLSVALGTCAVGEMILPLEKLLAEVPSVESAHAGIDANQQGLGKEIARHGAAAIDPLLQRRSMNLTRMFLPDPM